MRPISPASLRFLLSCARAESCACSALISASVPCRSERWLIREPAGNQAKRTMAEATIAPRKARRARPADPLNQDATAAFAPRGRRCAFRLLLPRAIPRASLTRQCGETREGGRLAEILLNAQQLVVLGDPVRTRRRTRLDLSRVDRDHQVRDGRVLGLPRTVRDHRAVR